LNSTISATIRLLRPKQWIKNLFVLAPLIFAAQFTVAHQIIHGLLAMLIFCIASSSVYIFNDIRDKEQDRLHPRKKLTRPIAAGLISTRSAAFLLICCYSLLIVLLTFSPSLAGVITIYIVLNYLYSFYLKNQPVIDIFIIAIGFVLRVYAGTLALHVPLSPWMFITTLSLALFLASAKRRQEIMNTKDNQSRKVLARYNQEITTKFAEFSAIMALVFYSIFTLITNVKLIWTIPLVIYGIFRYWYVLETQEKGESPTDLIYSDMQLIIVLVLWCLTIIYAYLPASRF